MCFTSHNGDRSPYTLIALDIEDLSVTARPALVKSRVCSPRVEPVLREEQAAKRYYVSGMVQGVGFRYFARGAALRLSINGYVRNLQDGRVEVYAIGPVARLAAFRAELERGPRGSSVSSVDEEDAEIASRFTSGFSIEYDN
jgi:acylphosphatase